MYPMRRIFQVVFLMLFAVSAEAQVQALVSHSSFLMGGKSPYTEMYLLVRGSSVAFVKNAQGLYQGQVEVTLIASQDSIIRFADKYIINSPETSDSTGMSFNFIDQQRIPLGNGNYSLKLEVKDVNRNGESVKASIPVELAFRSDSVSISNIQLVESYSKTVKPGPLSKGGYDLLPHISEFFGNDERKLIFYTEVYNTLQILGEAQKYLISFYIQDDASGKIIEQFSGFERANSAPVNVLMKEIDIENLPSGSYTLVVEARDRENKVLSKSEQSFIRAASFRAISLENLELVKLDGSFTSYYKNIDSLAEHIKCLRPIGSGRENQYAENVLKEMNMQHMQKYFLSFWLNRDALNPQEAWEKYRGEVIKVQKNFSSSIKRGYNTDRGRVYLQYGPPDNRTISTYEPSAYPYEIWQYYRLNNQSNRRFIFYNPDLVTNDFTLIHSDALGEIMNDQWQLLIYKRDTQTNDIDQENGSPHWGTQLQQNFQTPR